jgi:hypothetical protein
MYPRNPDFDDTPGIGAKVTVTAGTAIALSSTALPMSWVIIQAKRANTGRIYIGGSTILNTDTGGIYLLASETVKLDFTDGSKIYINSTVDAEGVTYVYSK